jgi:hypothetical protein
MIQAVQCLTAAGADVIVDDLGFFAEPYFQDGPVAAAVLGAVKAGVSYHSSAGNEARQHLEQDFVATPNSTLHDFAGGRPRQHEHGRRAAGRHAHLHPGVERPVRRLRQRLRPASSSTRT